MSAEAKAKAVENLKDIDLGQRSAFIINDSETDPIARDLVRLMGYPHCSILDMILIVRGQRAGTVILSAKGVNRFNIP